MTAEKIKESYDILEKYSETFFDEERHEKVMKIFERFQDRMVTAPASYKKEYHNAFAGGWIDHTVGVIKNAVRLYKVWKDQDAVDGFTPSEVVFSAMFHDWGGLGDLDNDRYIPQKSKWHRDRGMLYEFNPKLKDYMTVPIRSLFILQHHKVDMTDNEMMGIMLSDGMFEDINKAYFNHLKTNLPLIIHHADHMTTQVEKSRQIKKDKGLEKGFSNIFNSKEK
jgi:hypothetical protein